MCGIFQFSRTTPTTSKMTGPLAIYMEARGVDSWGASDGTLTHRSLGPITDFWSPQDVRNMNGPIYHTRHASVGAKTLRNAHPFEFAKPDGGKIIGVHNGHIDNWHVLKHKHSRETLECDSEHIFMHLAEGKSLADLDGWGAVIWYDIEPTGKKRKFCSRFGNQDNLHVAELADSTIVAASTEDSILVAARFAGIPIKQFFQIKEKVKYEILPKDFLEHQELDWCATPERLQPRTSFTTTFNPNGWGGLAGVCLMPTCRATVGSGSAICRKCITEVMMGYYGDNIAVVTV